MKHTPGELEVSATSPIKKGIPGFTTLRFSHTKINENMAIIGREEQDEANAWRLADCWNGCERAGITNPLAIPKLLEACELAQNVLMNFVEYATENGKMVSQAMQTALAMTDDAIAEAMEG